MFWLVYLNFSHKILRSLTMMVTVMRVSRILYVTKPRVTAVIKEDRSTVLRIINYCQINNLNNKALC